MRKILKSALLDIREGVRLRHLWIALASEDITDQHRRTRLGPAWVLVNYLIYMATFYVIFGDSSGIPNFIAYMALGMLVFQFSSEIITQGTSLYIREESFIAGTPLPLSVYVLRLTTESLIRSSYSIQGCLAILLIAGMPITLTWLWSIVGIALLLVIVPPLIVVLATLGAFFPDAQFVVSNVMRVAMFLTPLFWSSASGLRGQLYLWNPLTHFIEIVRLPITQGVVPVHSLAVCLCIGLVAWTLAILLLGRFRKKIVFLLS